MTEADALARLSMVLADLPPRSAVERWHGRARGPWAAVFGWRRLEELLATHAWRHPHTRLMREGDMVPERAYTARELRRGELRRQLVPARLATELSAGAMLVVDAVDELDLGVRRLCRAAEEHFDTEVQVNAYASWSEVSGLGAHADDHDVLVLQCEGSKDWRLGDQDGPGDVVRLESGDVLWLPVGLPHRASATDGPSLHLTFGLRHWSSRDRLLAALDRLPPTEEPDDATGRTDGQQVARARRDLTDVLADRDALEASPRGTTTPRLHVTLPGTTAPLAPTDEVALTGRLRLRRREDGSATVGAGALAIDAPADVVPAVALLVERGRGTAEQLARSTSTKADVIVVTLQAMVDAGLATT